MSHKAREWAARLTDVSRLEKTVLKEIADRYNDDTGYCWPSQKKLARDTGYSRASINIGLNGLEEKGYIFRQKVIDTDSGGNLSNRYSLPKYAPNKVPRKKVAYVSRSALRMGRDHIFREQLPSAEDWNRVLSLKPVD